MYSLLPSTVNKHRIKLEASNLQGASSDGRAVFFDLKFILMRQSEIYRI
jgi:hypothetical protein